jgi:predicted nucleic acid-binding protein
MILLDTNIISEVMRPTPATAVVEWLDRQRSHDLYLSAVTIAEIAYGIQVLPNGQRRTKLVERFDRFVSQGFDQRVLPFDTEAAYRYAEIMARRRQLGRPMSVPDGQIAAIALVQHFALATRNVSDFEHCGIDVLNPFQD